MKNFEDQHTLSNTGPVKTKPGAGETGAADIKTAFEWTQQALSRCVPDDLASAGETFLHPSESYRSAEKSQGFRGGAGVIETQHLRVLMPVFMAQLLSLVCGEQAVRGAITRLREIRKLLHMLYNAEKSNFRLLMTRALKADPLWQAQVREDLGGNAALARWEHRRDERRAAQDAKQPGDAAKDVRQPRINARPQGNRGGPLTDRNELFRLALIPRAAPHAQGKKPLGRSFAGPKQPAIPAGFAWHAPIPITPEGLRPAPVHETAVSRNSGNEPKPTGGELIDIWEAVQRDHFIWNHQLVLAGLELPSTDEGPAPP